ncbi:MAG TPA: peptidylprolyl isomerase [Elusimicrobiales bacterium]|nr:peptidylprolyl isomerase [Elusimicrobiales bacterium]
MKIKYFLPVAMLLLAVACNKKPDKTVARVGNSYITQGDYEEKQKSVPPEYAIYLETKQGKKQFLEILIKEKLTLKDAESLKLVKTENYKKEISKLRQDMDRDFEKYKEHLLTKLWLEKLKENGTLTVPESQIKDYHKRFPYEITIGHIMVDNHVEAEEILKKAKRKQDFAKLAKTYSQDPETKNKGGLASPFILGELFMPELEDAAYGLKINEVQGPFKTKFGYHVIKKYNAVRLSFKSARERILKILTKRKLDQHMEDLKKKYKVEVVDEEYM